MQSAFAWFVTCLYRSIISFCVVVRLRVQSPFVWYVTHLYQSIISFCVVNDFYCTIVYLALEITYWSWAKRIRLSVQSAFVWYVTRLYQSIFSFCVVNDFHCAIVLSRSRNHLLERHLMIVRLGSQNPICKLILQPS